MYYFIFDHVTDRRSSDLSHQIENEVINLGLAGETITLNPTSDIDSLLSSAHQKGYQTVVVVGRGKLVNMVAAKLVRYDAVMGIVPLDESPAIFSKIGSSNWQEAVISLRQRRWRFASLGRINNTGAFLTKAVISVNGFEPVSIVTDQFRAEMRATQILISTHSTSFKRNTILLECKSVVMPHPSSWWNKIMGGEKPVTSTSRFSGEPISILSDRPLPMMIDQTVIGRTPATLSVIPKALRLIVARSKN